MGAWSTGPLDNDGELDFAKEEDGIDASDEALSLDCVSNQVEAHKAARG